MMQPRHGRLMNSSSHPIDPNDPKPTPPAGATPTQPPPGFPSMEQLVEARKRAMGNKSLQESIQGNALRPEPTAQEMVQELPKKEEDIFTNGIEDLESQDLPIIELSSPVPSKGLSYPIGHKISYRPYVFGEIKKVSGSKTTFEELARTILTGIKTSFPLEDLTFYDFLYLALLRKISTIGDTTILATHVCPNKKCQNSNTYEIAVGPKNCEIDFYDVDYPELPIEVDLKLGEEEATAYRFSPLTIRQYLELERKNLHKDAVAKLAIQCTNLPFDLVRSRIYKAYADDTHVLSKVEDLLFHGVRPINVKCPNCGAINLLQLDGGGIIIRPFRSADEIVKDRIRFGKAPALVSDPPL